MGSSQVFFCSLGKYCEIYEFFIFIGNCFVGYFCNGTVSVFNFKECDMGYYCLEGIIVQMVCFFGIFLSKFVLLFLF